MPCRIASNLCADACSAARFVVDQEDGAWRMDPFGESPQEIIPAGRVCGSLINQIDKFLESGIVGHIEWVRSSDRIAYKNTGTILA